MNRRHFIQSAATMGALAPFANATSVLRPIFRTIHGPVMGEFIGSTFVFKGIPYGADTATTRFQSPKPPTPWTSPLACTSWPTRAPQQSPERPGARPNPTAAGLNALEDIPTHYHLPPDQGAQSEDCLHLNVWTPAQHGRRPVLFYIHGGAYNNGTANADLYDGTRLAQRDAVVVTVNHRLNAFGYLYLAELADGYRESGNVGMLDLVLALQWVRDNIANFGGDPHNVTIFGQSGGGAKCATLMAMPAAKGLFHKVLTMSGQQVWAVPRQKAQANAIAALFDLNSGPVTPAKLNALTTAQIQAAARTTPNWLPVNDGTVLHRDPFDPDAPPQSAAIPMILGNTKDEVAGANYWQRTGLTFQALPAELGKAIAPFLGPYKVEEIITAYRGWYPAYSPNDLYTAAVAAFRSWPGQVIEAERRASHVESARTTWVYQLDFGTPTADGRAPHTLDLAFVFDNLRLSPGMVGASEQDLAAAQPLATQMSSMLLALARTGNPNTRGLPHWPTYSLRQRETMLFDRVARVEGDARSKEREMMVGAHYRQPGT